MHESSKSIFGKIRDSRYATRYIVGDGIDIGAGPDSIAQYYELFPLMKIFMSRDNSRLLLIQITSIPLRFINGNLGLNIVLIFLISYQILTFQLKSKKSNYLTQLLDMTSIDFIKSKDLIKL
jgi:hypothetical protein